MNQNIEAGTAAKNIYQQVDVIELAKGYIDRGFCPIPVDYKSKKPSLEKWQSTTVTHDNVAKLFGQNPSNIGIVLGNSSDLLDIDIDDDAALALAPSFLPETAMMFGRKSRPRSHYIYRCKSARYKKIGIGAGKPILEIRCGNHQTAFPGSVHPTGELVAFDTEGEPATVAYDDIEFACLKLAIATVLSRSWASGHRHDLALATSALFAKARWRIDDAETVIRAVASATGDDEMEDRLAAVTDTYERFEAGATIEGYNKLCELLGQETADGLQKWSRSGQEAALTPMLSRKEIATLDVSTDLRAAETFAKTYKDSIIYCGGDKSWFRRNNQVYKLIDPVVVQGVAMTFARDVSKEIAGRLPNGMVRAQLEFCSRINGLVQMSRSRLLVDRPDIDKSRDLLGLGDGSVYDLNTMGFSSGGNAIVTKCIGTQFDPDATCPTWEAFIDRIFASNREVISFVQRAVGYTLSGRVGEQCLFVLIGTGANGKSTFINALTHLFDDYAATIPMHSLTLRHGGNEQTNDLALLPGKRFVSASEGEPGQRLAESRVKLMTGGDRIACRAMYKDYFEFDPQFKLWLATNSFPRVNGFDEAIWRRIKVIEFPVTIPQAERDPDLTHRLHGELPGILNWALQGYRDWQRRGLDAPSQVDAATKRYRTDNDTVEQFIEACCDLSLRVVTSTKQLYERYSLWCENSGQEALAKNMFGKALSSKGLTPKNGSKGNAWKGIALKADAE